MGYKAERIVSNSGGVTIIKDNDAYDSNMRYAAVGKDLNGNHCVGYGESIELAKEDLMAERNA